MSRVPGALVPLLNPGTLGQGGEDANRRVGGWKEHPDPQRGGFSSQLQSEKDSKPDVASLLHFSLEDSNVFHHFLLSKT